jgi:hypothetical protein
MEEEEDSMAEDMPSKMGLNGTHTHEHNGQKCNHNHGQVSNLGSMAFNTTNNTSVNSGRKGSMMSNLGSMAPGSNPTAAMFKTMSMQGNNSTASNKRFSVSNSRSKGGGRRSDSTMPYGQDTYYDRRRAGANMSKEEFDVCAEALGQELWALMTFTVDMLWDTEQLMEKMIVIATRCVCVCVCVCVYLCMEKMIVIATRCYIYIYIYICIMCLCVYIYIHTHAYTGICTHTHTCIHTYIHTSDSLS